MSHLPLVFAAILAGASALYAGPARTADYFLTDYDEALRESEASGKPVFLDAFTTWCKPCREMDARVFPDAAVRALLTTEFVPLRLDMERGQGQRLAERFGVSAYPTLLVFDAEGELHRATGFLDAKALRAFAKTSRDATANTRGLRIRYARGDRDTALLLRLAAIAREAQLPEQERYVYDYLIATDDWAIASASDLLLRGPQTTDTPLFDSLVSRQLQLERAFSVPVVEERIYRLTDATLFPGEGLSAKPRTAKRLLRRAYGPAADSAYHRFRMRRAREAGDAKAFGRWAIKSQRRYPTSDPDELEELVYIFDARLEGRKEKEVAAWRARAKALRAARGY